jgi:hypothetical protein
MKIMNVYMTAHAAEFLATISSSQTATKRSATREAAINKCNGF